MPSITCPPASPDPAGNNVPGYEILRVLSPNIMGRVVYQARHLRLDRLVVLTVQERQPNTTIMADFKTEADTLARLQHPNIVQFHEAGEYDEGLFFSVEFCPGGPLDQKLNGIPLSPGESAQLLETLARAIQTVHQAKILHCHLTPANISLTQTGEPRITDFGLARVLNNSGSSPLYRVFSEFVVGTPAYLAPEQVSGKPKEVGLSADVYALGAILYECLTGRPPFQASTPLQTLLQVVSDEPVPPGRLESKTPRNLETICLKCLRKKPSQRYASAEALAEDLARFRRGEPIVARPVGRLERGIRWIRRNAVAALTAVLVLVLVGSFVVSRWLVSVARGEAQAASRAAKQAGERAESEKNRADDEALAARQAEKKVEDQLKRAERLLYAGHLALAQAAYAEGNGAVPLQRPEKGKEVLPLKEQPGPVKTVVFSPDGKQMVTVGKDNTVKVWDAAKGKEIFSLKGHTNPVTRVAFSSDGKRIFAWDDQKKVLAWSAETGKAVEPDKPPPAAPTKPSRPSVPE